MKKIFVLGGGLSGLSAALHLLETGKGYEVSVLEKNNFLGGLAASFQHNNEKIPVFYHHVFKHDHVTRKYLSRFGLHDEMEWKKIRMSILVNNKNY